MFVNTFSAFIGKFFGVNKAKHPTSGMPTSDFYAPYLILDKNAGACIGAEVVMQAFQERKRNSMNTFSAF